MTSPRRGAQRRTPSTRLPTACRATPRSCRRRWYPPPRTHRCSDSSPTRRCWRSTPHSTCRRGPEVSSPSTFLPTASRPTRRRYPRRGRSRSPRTSPRRGTPPTATVNPTPAWEAAPCRAPAPTVVGHDEGLLAARALGVDAEPRTTRRWDRHDRRQLGERRRAGRRRVARQGELGRRPDTAAQRLDQRLRGPRGVDVLADGDTRADRGALHRVQRRLRIGGRGAGGQERLGRGPTAPGLGIDERRVVVRRGGRGEVVADRHAPAVGRDTTPREGWRPGPQRRWRASASSWRSTSPRSRGTRCAPTRTRAPTAVNAAIATSPGRQRDALPVIRPPIRIWPPESRRLWRRRLVAAQRRYPRAK